MTARSWRRRAEEYAATFPDDAAWAIVFQFYAALHLTQAYLTAKGERFDAKGHRERTIAIRNSPELRAMREEFQDLRT